MAVSRQILDEIRARVDIVDLVGSYITLKRAGTAYKALCPFHREKTPSFTVNPARQIYHCFGCGAGGDVFKFVMQHENVQFMDAIRLLAQRAGVDLEFTESERKEESRKDLLYKAHEEAQRFYQEILLNHPSAAIARAYLEERKLGPEVVEQFGLGYAPGGFDVMERFAAKRGFSMELLETAGFIATNEQGRRYDRFRERLMFPIRDLSGRIIAFSGRILTKDDRTAKYLNSPETPLFRKSRTLFAMDRARKPIIESRTALLCEGQIDVIRCHLAGFTHAVAALGTALTEEHAAVIKRHADRVLLVMDADNAGQNSALRSAEIFLGAELSVEVAQLPVGEDPDSLIMKRGAEAFAAVIAKPRSVIDFQVDVLASREDMKQEVGIRRVARAALETIRHSASEVQRGRMLRELSMRVGLPEHTLRDELRRTAPQQRFARAGETADPDATPAPQTTPPPEEERHLLWLVLHHPESAELVYTYVRPEHFADARCRVLFELLAPGHGEDFTAAARERGEEYLALAAELASDERRIREDERLRTAATQDCIITIRRKALETELRELTRQRSDAPLEEQAHLIGEIATIKRYLFMLREGWEKAALVLEL
ncbi:MAG TPA: DNA primase [Kiritimatiellia bacterium]|nr:DNA primase [Kiritimatiellia bacterium]